LLETHGVRYRYREYTEEPLSEAEIRTVLDRLGIGPRAVLRKRDKAYREQGLTGDETDAQLIRLMAAHPTLLQRPIGLAGERAVLGRPPEKLLELADG